MRAFSKVLGLAFGLSVAASFSFAGTTIVITDTCEYWDVTVYKNNDSAEPVQSLGCIGEVSGTVDSAGYINSESYFGLSTWELDSRYNMPGDSEPGSWDPEGILNFDPEANVDESGLLGTWGVSGWDGIESAILVIKASNGFAAYLLDIAEGESGGWTTLALSTKIGQQPAISHISLYVSLAAIPLPASGLLLLGGLAGFGLVRRKRAALA